MKEISKRKRNDFSMIRMEKLFVFAKAQLSAFFGGIIDYSLMIFFTEFFGFHYIISIALGGIVGAAFNFFMNRRWAFRSKERPYIHSSGKQMLKFIIVVLNSIILKASGTFFFTSYMLIDYKISRIMTDMTVSLVFNFMLQKHWVFKNIKRATTPCVQDTADYVSADGSPREEDKQ